MIFVLQKHGMSRYEFEDIRIWKPKLLALLLLKYLEFLAFRYWRKLANSLIVGWGFKAHNSFKENICTCESKEVRVCVIRTFPGILHMESKRLNTSLNINRETHHIQIDVLPSSQGFCTSRTWGVNGESTILEIVFGVEMNTICSLTTSFACFTIPSSPTNMSIKKIIIKTPFQLSLTST